MAHDVRLPKIDSTGSEITVAAWLKQPGDAVRVGDIIAEVQTDKVNIEIESPASGTLDTIIAKEGDVVVEGDLLARVAAL